VSDVAAETGEPARAVPAAGVVAKAWEPPAVAVLAVFVVLSLWLTFRHLSKFGSAIPGTPGDSLLNLWILTHVQDSVLHGWHALWNAPIFAPAPNTLAYSESMFVVALVDWPLRLLFGPVAAFNLVHVAATVLASWCTYRLAMRYTRGWSGAFIGALVYAYAAARVTDFGHFQIVVGGALVPLVLLALVRCLDAPSPGRGALLGLAFAVTVMTASYDGALAAVLVAIVAIGWMLWRRPAAWRSYLLAGVIAVAVVAGLAGPFAYEYLHLQHQSGFQRAFVPGMALHLSDFVRAPARSLATHLPIVGPGFRASGAGHPVFPGFVGLAGAIGGLVVVLRRPRDELGRRRRELLLVCLAGAVLVLFAFGDYTVIHGHHVTLVYGYVRDVLPGFSGLRALTRLALGAQLAIALLAAVGVDALLFGRSLSWRIVGTVALAGIVCAEGSTGIELSTVPTARDDNGFVQVLRALPRGTVAELPIESAGSGAGPWAYVEMPRQLEALRDHDPRVNGYSGFEPSGFDSVAKSLNDFPSHTALAEARALGVRYVLLRTELVGDTPGSIRYVLGRSGAGRYTDAVARSMVDHLPRGAGRVVGHVSGGWVIELDR
jgi:hypothetical protein